MKKIEIYTDGACSGNPGPGGFSAILSFKSHEKIVSGSEQNTTNNRMELRGVIEGLSALKEPCEVKLYTDSAYVSNAIIEKWLEVWQLNGWKNSQKKEIANKDLWQKLLELLSKHKVKFIKVKGHSNNEKNNRCDEIARGEIEKLNLKIARDTSIK
jgi:ribonuclease HI